MSGSILVFPCIVLILYFIKLLFVELALSSLHLKWNRLVFRCADEGWRG